MKEKILNTISDLCSNFLYYDRKEDEELSIDTLKDAISDGIITIDEMVSEFRIRLENSFPMPHLDTQKQKNMKIRFVESYSFVGRLMTLEVNENYHILEINENQTYEQHAVNLLKEIYDIDFKPENVKFKWDGTL